MRLKWCVREGLVCRFDIFVVDEGKYWSEESGKLRVKVRLVAKIVFFPYLQLSMISLFTSDPCFVLNKG